MMKYLSINIIYPLIKLYFLEPKHSDIDEDI